MWNIGSYSPQSLTRVLASMLCSTKFWGFCWDSQFTVESVQALSCGPSPYEVGRDAPTLEETLVSGSLSSILPPTILKHEMTRSPFNQYPRLPALQIFFCISFLNNFFCCGIDGFVCLFLKREGYRNDTEGFLGDLIVKTSSSTAGGEGLMPNWGAEIPPPLRPKKKQNMKQKQDCNKFSKNGSY